MPSGMGQYQRAGMPDCPSSFRAGAVQPEKTGRGKPDAQPHGEGTRQAAASTPWLRALVVALTVWGVWFTSAAASVVVLQAQQVTDASGTPLRESEILLWVPGLPAGLTEADFAFEVLVQNPADGVELFVLLDILAVVPKDNGVVSLFVDGPVSTGSLLWVSPDVVGGAEGELIEFNTLTRFLSPREAALWGKAYEPTNLDLFPSSIFLNSPPIEIPQSTDPAVVRQDLANHFQRFVDVGEMNQGQMSRMLRIYDNDKYRQSFVDPTTDQFEPQLMAAVLSTAGTPGQGSIAAIIGGKNETGWPAQVFYEDLLGQRIAEAAVIQDPNGQDQWVIRLNSRMRNEPFQVGSAITAHEAMHQDNLNAQDEEIAGKSAEINTWKQHLLVNPELASANTPVSRFLNLEVLMHENSGQSFPNGGLFEALLAQSTQDIIPTSGVLDQRSLEDFLRNNVYAGLQDVDTPGNRYLNSFLRQGARGQWQPNQGFNDNTVAKLDNPQYFTPAENFQVLEILEEQTVIKSLGPSVQHGGEEGQAQQAPPQKIIPW